MMLKESFTVKYITVNNCFVKLPEYWLRKLSDQNPVLKISHGKTNHFVTYASKPSQDNALRISATYARTLDIKEDEQVFVSSIQNVPLLTSIKVIPQTAHDLEIVALQKDKIQLTLLQQVRVVAKNQAIVVWVSKFSYVTLLTESLKPNVVYGMLEDLTEVHVSDAVATEHGSSYIENRAAEKLSKRLEKEAADDDLVSSEIKALVKSFRNRTTPYIFRVCDLPKMTCPFGRNSKFDEIMCSPFHAFISKRHLPKGINLTDTAYMYCKITKIPQDRQHVDTRSTNFLVGEKTDDLEAPTELTLNLYIMEEIRDRCSQSVQKAFENVILRLHRGITTVDWLYRGIHNAIYLSDTAMTNLKLKTGSKIILQLTGHLQDSPISHVRIYPHTPLITKQDFMKYVKKFSKYNLLLLNSSCTIVEDSVPQFTVKFLPERCTWSIFSISFLEKIEMIERTKVDFKRFDDIPKKPEKKEPEPIDIQCQAVIREKCTASLILSLGLHDSVNFEVARENILICGEMGTGKTTVCNLLMEDLETGPYFVHTNFIDCKPLKGKKVEVLQKIITSAVVECAYYQPSLLILENLECITNVSTTDEENTPDSINAARTTDMIINIVTRYQETRYVSVIGTCRSADKLGRRLRPARGTDFFRTVYTIRNPDESSRCTLLSCVLGNVVQPQKVDSIAETFAKKTEGWTVQDVVDMCMKAVFEDRKRFAKFGVPGATYVTEQDIEKAFREYTPMSLRDLTLHKDSKYSWSDIGGLNSIKRCLIETIQWPLIYPEIFKKAPIKLQNGVLIYGMPGTGKTMLAKAIANECKVNLISVKGPELLSKYIGVSEESVRNVFQRALRAKPCVLFFDEFDSLAPRRGHDSTGVTDRVVNQLLTQLDGVEDREGVVVVAASSRPDLLDPALLRPGRLDKSLYCPLPDEDDRWEILKALCRTLKVDVRESDLKNIARLSPGFTGADLNAVLTQARLSALEAAVAAVPSGKLRLEDIKVTHRQLTDSVKKTRPSLSQMEKEKYKKIYAKFSNGSNFTEEILQNQKATLA